MQNSNQRDHRIRPLLLAVGLMVIALATAASVWAEDDESVGWQVLDREAAVRQALAQNLELRAATWEVRKAQARLRWSGKLRPP